MGAAAVVVNKFYSPGNGELKNGRDPGNGFLGFPVASLVVTTTQLRQPLTN